MNTTAETQVPNQGFSLISVHVCRGEWFKLKILKADHPAALAIATTLWSKICLAARREFHLPWQGVQWHSPHERKRRDQAMASTAHL